MNADEIIEWLDSREIEVCRCQYGLQVNAPLFTLDGELLERIRANEDKLLHALERENLFPQQYQWGYLVATETWKDVCRKAEEAARGKFNEGVQIGLQLAPKEPPGLGESTIERAIRLCHPDKHDNSQASNEVTQELLRVRGGSR